MSFVPPSWSGQPCRLATLEILGVDGGVEKQDIDLKPFYLFGRAADQVDFALEDASCSRVHAALVHHQDGRLFVIDLHSTHGTHVDGKRIDEHKPTGLKTGSELRFGSFGKRFVVRCESAGTRESAITHCNCACRQFCPNPQEGGDFGSQAKMQARASHLLVKHKDSRRPSSWKEERVTRTEPEALAMIQAFRERISSGQVEFATLATTESHCSSARKGGDLGMFGPGQMQAAFEEATFALKVGELSQPVFSDSGVHLILRTA
ncbi:MAG: hypothetical protein WDW38_008887 [Sanguina aurantia]